MLFQCFPLLGLHDASALLQQQTLRVQLLHSVLFLALSLSLMMWYHYFVVVKPYMAFSLT